MNARDLVSKLLPILALATLTGAAAFAEPILTIELLDHSVFTDIPPDRIVIEVSVAIDSTEVWTGGGLHGAIYDPRARFLYSIDPNGAGPFLTAPDRHGPPLTVDEKYATFVSLPRPQTAPGRFNANGAAWLVSGLLGPRPVGRPTSVDVAYADPVGTDPEGAGYTQRLAIDISQTGLQPSDFYISTSGPQRPGDVLIGDMLSQGDTWPVDSMRLEWQVFAVPEPSALVLIVAAGLAASRRARG